MFQIVAFSNEISGDAHRTYCKTYCMVMPRHIADESVPFSTV